MSVSVCLCMWGGGGLKESLLLEVEEPEKLAKTCRHSCGWVCNNKTLGNEERRKKVQLCCTTHRLHVRTEENWDTRPEAMISSLYSVELWGAAKSQV